MRVIKVPFSSYYNTPVGPRIVGGPAYIQNVDQQVTVGTSIVLIFSLAAFPNTNMAWFRNSSTGGQQIRVGQAPTFAATPSGMLLMPGDTAEVRDITGGPSASWNAIANAAGALLDLQEYFSL